MNKLDQSYLIRTIEDLQADIANQEKLTRNVKHCINTLCVRAGIPIKYPEVTDLRRMVLTTHWEPRP